MTDKEHREQERRINALLKKWGPVLLPGWDALYEFYRGPFTTPQDDGRTPIADMRANWQYMSFRMRWDTEQAVIHSDHELEKHVIHEYCHGLLNEMRYFNEENGIKHEERVATTVQIALMAAYEAGKKARV